MKTCLSFLIVFLALPLFASINPEDLVVQTDPTTKTLTLRSVVRFESATKVQILDAAERVLHTANLESGTYLNTRFQLAALPVGYYEIVVADALGRTVQPMLIGEHGIEADPALASRNFFPRVNLKEDLLTINYLNREGSKVDIRLSDENGNAVLEDRLDAATTVQRAYNLEKLPAGEYFVTVRTQRQPNYTTSLRLE